MTGDARPWPGQRHCGAVRFEATLTNGLNGIFRCNCSYCRMRGAVIVPAEKGGVVILQGEDTLTPYRFNTGVAQHYFCSRCGISTHLQRRSDPNLLGVNVACLEGISPFDFAQVTVIDGIHHPNDTGRPLRRAGVLSFSPSD